MSDVTPIDAPAPVPTEIQNVVDVVEEKWTAAKAVAAGVIPAVGGLLLAVSEALPDGTIRTVVQGVLGVVTVLGTVIGVYKVPNRKLAK